MSRPRLPRRLRRLRWPLPFLLTLLLTAAAITLLFLGHASEDALVATVGLIGAASVIAGLVAIGLAVACASAQYCDPGASACIRCGYPRPSGPVDPMHPCSECGLLPIESIRPPRRWRAAGVLVHLVECVVLIGSGVLLLWLVSMVYSMGA